MRIAFYIEDLSYGWMLEAACESARKHMPAVEIVQISPVGYAQHPCTNQLLSHSYREPPDYPRNFLGRYFSAAHMVEGDMVLSNVDVLFRGSIEHVFEREFEVALPHISSPDARADGALIFARNPKRLEDSPSKLFWSVLRNHPVCFREEHPVIDQLRWINDCYDAFPGKKLLIPGARYSYVPASATDACSSALVVHYRGDRKHWMAAAVGIPYDASWGKNRNSTHPGLKEKKR